MEGCQRSNFIYLIVCFWWFRIHWFYSCFVHVAVVVLAIVSVNNSRNLKIVRFNMNNCCLFMFDSFYIRSIIRLLVSIFKVQIYHGYINYDIVVGLCFDLLTRLSYYIRLSVGEFTILLFDSFPNPNFDRIWIPNPTRTWFSLFDLFLNPNSYKIWSKFGQIRSKVRF